MLLLGILCQEGFYIGPALAHYQCYCVLTKDTKTITISRTVKFCPHNVPSPDVTMEDKLIRALHDINMTITQDPMQPSVDQHATIETLCATRTHSQSINTFALLADNDTDNTFTAPMSHAYALPVLDAAMGQLLEHQQLCHHPTYTDTLDTSYTNELRCLYQGVSTNPTKPTEK